MFQETQTTLEHMKKEINWLKEPYRREILSDEVEVAHMAAGETKEVQDYLWEMHRRYKNVGDDADDEVSANITKEYEGISVSAVSKSVNRIAGTFVKSGAFAKYLIKKLNKDKRFTYCSRS